MGLLDFFKKKPKVTAPEAETPEPQAETSEPEPGTIESYVVADNVGTVRLANGTVLRFGRSACKGFEPAVGVKVQVSGITPHPLGGQRAGALVRDPADADYERRVEARDSEAVYVPSLPHAPPTLPTRPIDSELLKRLGNIAGVNALVRGGQDPERLVLALNVDAEGNIERSRPAVGFHFDVERKGPDRWRLSSGIDGATAYCRFWLDLTLPELPQLDPATFDMADAPGFAMAVSKPPDHERNPLARSAFLLAWRVEGGMDSPSLEGPLEVGVTVMGVELCRLPHVYLFTGRPDEHWVLLKCHRGEQGFFLGLDLSTGAAEVFPRRHDLESYRLALDFLRTFT